MADVITRLKVESTEYDSKIKRASQGLLQMEQACRKVGGTLAILEKDEMEFVKGLGKMETVSKDARGQLNELTKAFTDLSLQYKRLTDEEKQGDFGKALSASLDQLKTRIQDTKKELSGIDSSLNGGKGAFNQLFSGVAGKFGMSPQMFTGVGSAIAGVGMAAKLAGDNIRTAFNFERSISGLSALTGMVGKDLEKLKNNAIELGSTTTLTASQVADAFRLIGSQQPQLLSDAEALKEVTKYAIRLSEAAGIDLATASQTLSTSINQMGGDSANAARYVNVLAAASQKGSGDISWLGEAITKAATAAKAVGADYEELVANLEQLAKAGFDASTAGTALRSIIMNLEKQANSQFKPSVVGLTQAFDNLGKAQLDITGYQEIAGKMFATQAKVLAEAAGAAKEMQEAITGTNIAEEQAQTNTANLDGSLKALASAWEGLNLHINDSNGFLKSCVDWLKETVQWMDNTFTAAGRAKKALDDLRGGGEDGNGRKIDTRTEYEVKEVKSAMQGEGDSAKMKQQQILDKYDRDIAAKQKELDRASAQVANAAKSGNYTSIATAQNIEERLRNEVEALKTLKQEFKSASDALITPKQAPQKTEIINTEEVEESQKSIKQLQDELKKLKQARDEAADAGKHELVEEYNADIKRIQAEIKAMRGGSTSSKSSTPKTEAQQNEAAIAKLTEEYQNIATAAKTADDAQKDGMTERMKAIQGEIKTLQERNAELKKFADEAKGVKVAVDVPNAMPQLTQQLKDLQQAQSQSIDTREWVEYQKQIDVTTTKIDILKGKWKEGQVATFSFEEKQPDKMVFTADNKDVLTKLAEIREAVGGIEIDEKTLTVTANTAEAVDALRKIDELTVRPKAVFFLADNAEVLDKLREVNGVSIDDKTLTVTANTAEAYNKVQELIGGIEGTTVSFEVKPDITYTDANMHAFLSDLKKQVQQSELGSELYNNLTAQIADANALANLMQTAIKNGIDVTQFNPQDLWSKVFGQDPGDYITDAQWEEIEAKINEELKKMNIEPIQLNFATGGLNTIRSQAKGISDLGEDISKSWGNAASSISSIGSALNSIQDPAAQVAGLVANAIATIAQTFAKSLSGTATPWDWIAGAVAGTATMISTIAAIKTATSGHYAEGGIVPGNDYTDNTPIMVSSGELILNKAQQNNIAAELTSRDNGGGYSYEPVTISSENIRIIMRNGARRRGMSVAEYLEL